MTKKVATVFGGSGFLGRHIIRRLAADGWTVRVVSRFPDLVGHLVPAGDVGQILPIYGDLLKEDTVARAVKGADVVINLVGILYERGARRFKTIHQEGAARVARLAKAAGVADLIHLSALGADIYSQSAYARSKGEGETLVREAFPEAVILRPSVVFGPEDDFFNRFARLAQLSPVLPVFTADGLKVTCHGLGQAPTLDLFGSGGPSFQPVYVGDVADAAVAVLSNSALRGQTFELGGPERVTLKQVLELVVRYSGLKRRYLPIPLWLAGLQSEVLQFLPKPVLTPDQVKLLAVDNVVSGNLPGFEALGIVPTTIESVVPSYIIPTGPGGAITRGLAARH